jgi:hypothetical protein
MVTIIARMSRVTEGRWAGEDTMDLRCFIADISWSILCLTDGAANESCSWPAGWCRDAHTGPSLNHTLHRLQRRSLQDSCKSELHLPPVLLGVRAED